MPELPMSLEARLAALELPLPLKRMAERVLGLLSADRRQEELLQAAEMTARIAGLAALAACRHSGIRAEALDRVCSRLDRPSFGVWVELLRTAAAKLREDGNLDLAPLLDGLAARVSKGSALEALALLLKPPQGRPPATVQEIFDAFPGYRNAVRGHAVGVDVGARERAAGPLLDGLLALWEAVPPTGGLRVVHVVRIEETAGGAFADLLALHGGAPLASRQPVGAESVGMPGTVQLHAPPSTWIRLTPLAMASEDAGAWQLGWLAGAVVAPTFSYQAEARSFQGRTTQAEFESVLGIGTQAAVDEGLQARLRLDPYRGLLAYEEADAPVYFGREEEVGRALAILRERGAVVISGASGSGKSSLMRAGIIPALKRGVEGGAPRELPLVMLPDRRPMGALRDLLRKAGPEAPAEAAAWSRMVAELLPDGGGAPDGLAHLLRGLAGRDRTVVLAVDQLEELVTNDVPPAERTAFLDALAAAGGSGARVVTTVRSDLIGPLLEHEGFRKLHDASVMTIGGIDATKLTRIIREPLRGRRVEIEPDLPDAIIREVEGRPGALALLSQVLTTLWEERAAFGNRIARAGYASAGGVQGCVAAQAGKARAEVPPDRLGLLDAVLLQLVSRGEHDTFVRRRVALAEVAQVVAAGASDVRAVLAPFVARRLVVLSSDAAHLTGADGGGSTSAREETAEVAHEAFISAWPHLRDLVASQVEVLELRRRIEEGADSWEASGRRREFWNDDLSDLLRAEELLDLGRLALAPARREFLVASRGRVRARERLQRVMVAGLVALLGVAGLGFLLADRARRAADDASGVANAATVEARGAKARVDEQNEELARQGRLKRAEVHRLLGRLDLPVDPRGALANSIASLRLDANGDATTWVTCMQAVENGGGCDWVSPDASDASGRILCMTLVGGGGLLMVGSEGGRIAAATLPSRQLAGRCWISQAATCIAISPDGALAASGTREGDVWLWDVRTGGDRGRLEGHAEYVTSLEFSLDGARLISGAADGTVRTWDVASHEELLRLRLGRVTAVALSGDGAHAAAASWDRSARVWDARTGNLVREIDGHEDAVLAVAFDHGGSRIATGGADGRIVITDVAGGGSRRLDGGDGEGVECVRFAPDDRVVAGGGRNGSISFWDVSTGRRSSRLSGHGTRVGSLAWSADGALIVSGGDDRTIRIWDSARGVELSPVDGHSDVVKAVAFAPDGLKVVSGSWDATVRVWDVGSGKEIVRLRGHEAGVNAVAVSPDGGTIASGSSDHTVRLWDAATGRIRRTLTGHPGAVMAVHFSPDGRWIASGGDDRSVRLWDPSSGAAGPVFQTAVPDPTASPDRLPTPMPVSTAVYSVAFSPDGAKLAAGSGDHAVTLWDVASRSILHRLPLADTVESVAFSPDGRTLLTGGGRDYEVVEWDVATGKPFASLTGHRGLVTGLATSADGSLMASASVDRTVRVAGLGWTVVLGGHEGPVECLAFNRDGTKVVSGGRDDTVRLWNLSATRELRQLAGMDAFATAGAFSRDGAVLATAGGNGVVTTWTAATGARIRDFTGHAGIVTVVGFSPDATLLATGSVDTTVHLWDLATGERLRPIRGHTAGITALDFDGAGARIATGSRDSTVRVWDVESATCLHRFEGHDPQINGVLFVDEGTLAVRMTDRSIKLWDLRTGSPSSRDVGADSDSGRRLRARFPAQLGETTRVCAGAGPWIAAWWEQRAWAGDGLAPKAASLLDRWERSMGLRVDPASGLFDVLPSPGSAYAGKPEAIRCR